MRVVDVNVLVYAHRTDVEDHDAYLRWLDEARLGDEPLGLSDVVLSAFVRIVTHPKVFKEPSSLDTALGFVDALKSSPAALRVTPGERHWSIFEELCRVSKARGNAVPDASLAALAIEQNATWITADRGFSRFPGLRWRHPLDAGR